MPRMDRTGPSGQGSGTGRGKGMCQTSNNNGKNRSNTPKGSAMGRNSCRSRGRGFR